MNLKTTEHFDHPRIDGSHLDGKLRGAARKVETVLLKGPRAVT
jgi:hypothetical protein